MTAARKAAAERWTMLQVAATCTAWMMLSLVIFFPNFDPIRRAAAAEGARERPPAESLRTERGGDMLGMQAKCFPGRLICA
jgi:hypothetical protein